MSRAMIYSVFVLIMFNVIFDVWSHCLAYVVHHPESILFLSCLSHRDLFCKWSARNISLCFPRTRQDFFFWCTRWRIFRIIKSEIKILMNSSALIPLYSDIPAVNISRWISNDSFPRYVHMPSLHFVYVSSFNKFFKF